MIGRSESGRAERLRLTVDCLPRDTRLAMLEGIKRYEIIAGAYTKRDGGVCPMLAAHRCGGRTDFSGFARAWDRFTGARKRARRATERELRTLRAQLEASLWNDEEVVELRQEAQRLAGRRSERDAAGAHPSKGSSDEAPRAWLVPQRAWDDYRVVLEQALRQAEGDAPVKRRPRRPVAPSSPRG